jgi:hypothetical protein
MIAVASFNPTAVGLLAVGGAVGVGFAVVFAFRYAASFPALPAAGPETSDLGEEPPAIANLLVNRCHLTRAAAAATLVDLAARNHLELFEAGPGHFVARIRSESPDALTSSERQVMDLVRAKATGGSAPLEAIQLDDDEAATWHDRFAKQVISEAKSRGLLRGRWSRLDWTLFAVLAGAALLLVAAGLFAAHVEQTGRLAASSRSTRRFRREDWFWVAIVAWAIVLALLARLRSIRYSPTGTRAASRWLGVKGFLRHDPSFADATPAAVAIWNRLLAYGTALGAARGTAAAIPLGAEDRGTAWSRYGGDWHQVHVEYPHHFGYGQRPASVAFGGLVRALFWGALAFVALPVVLNAIWNVGSDAINRSQLSNGAVIGLVGVFFVVFGLLGVVLLARLADGLIRLWYGVADLGRTATVEGLVVKTLRAGAWFAVDPGHVDHVKAWHPGAATLPARGATVRVAVTRHLQHVARVDVVANPPEAERPAAEPAPLRWAAPAGATTLTVGVDAAAVRECSGMSLPEVDPASLAGPRDHFPPGAAIRAFSDGTSRILIGAMPEGAGWLSARAPSGLASRLTAGAAQGRWTQDRVFVQLGAAGLVVVDVELAGRSSADREQVARALAARVDTAPAAPSG